MEEFANTLPQPDLGSEYIREKARESRNCWEAGVGFFWVSLIFYLGTVFIIVLLTACTCLGQKGDGLGTLIMLAFAALFGLAGVGASMLLSIVSALYSRRGTILFLVELVTALFLLFLLFFPFFSFG